MLRLSRIFPLSLIYGRAMNAARGRYTESLLTKEGEGKAWGGERELNCIGGSAGGRTMEGLNVPSLLTSWIKQRTGLTIKKIFLDVQFSMLT